MIYLLDKLPNRYNRERGKIGQTREEGVGEVGRKRVRGMRGGWSAFDQRRSARAHATFVFLYFYLEPRKCLQLKDCLNRKNVWNGKKKCIDLNSC